MRLSRPLSAAIGVSGRASAAISSEPTLISTPPSLTRSSCLRSPCTVRNVPVVERRDRVGERERVGILRLGALDRLDGGTRRRVHQLHRAGLVAEDDELHLLLIADGLDPPGHRDGTVGKGLQLLDKNAFTHEGPVYVASRCAVL